MTTTPDPARELSEALAGAERNEAEMLVRESLRHGELGPVDVSLPIVLAELDRLKRVEAAAREVVKHYETTDWDAHEVADYHRQDMLLDALARELARPAGEDGGGGE